MLSGFANVDYQTFALLGLVLRAALVDTTRDLARPSTANVSSSSSGPSEYQTRVPKTSYAIVNYNVSRLSKLLGWQTLRYANASLALLHHSQLVSLKQY